MATQKLITSVDDKIGEAGKADTGYTAILIVGREMVQVGVGWG